MNDEGASRGASNLSTYNIGTTLLPFGNTITKYETM